MQLEQFYNIATIVSSRKSDTTFGDLPDWLNYFQNQIGSLILGLIYLSICRYWGPVKALTIMPRCAAVVSNVSKFVSKARAGG